jgi:hypothetical protein
VLVWLTLLLLSSFTPSIYHMAATVRRPKPTKAGACSSLPVPNNARLPNGPPPATSPKPHLSLLLALPRLPFIRITNIFFKTLRVSLYVSPINHSLGYSACCPAARFPLVPPTLAPEAHPRHVGGRHKYSKSHTLCMAPLKSGPLNDGPRGGGGGAQRPRPGA